MSSLQVTVGQYSDKGIKSDNEDYFGMLAPDEPLRSTKGIAFAIADGMSGSAAGKEASEASVSGFLCDYFSTPETWTVRKSCEKVMGALNRWLYGRGDIDQHHSHGWVTTFNGLIIKSNTASLFHVGDSRIYHYRDGRMEQLTRDHRVIVSKDRNYLSRALGIELFMDIDYRTQRIEVGDYFIMTTDGIHDYMDDATILRMLKSYKDNLQQFAEEVVNKALLNGSQDNLTCQTIRVDSLPDQDIHEVYRHLTELPFPPPLEIGMILDGYKIIEERHASKRTQIYLVENTETGERAIMKTPSVNYQDDPSYIEQFTLEEWIGRRIHNPNVVKTLKQKQHRQCLYYLIEAIEGKTLRAWIDHFPGSEISEICRLTKQIAKGLQAFHRLEMVHRDLKPENIMIDSSGVVKIIDLGSVRIAGIDEIDIPIDRNKILGTINYSAPELLLGEGGNASSDIFSLGVIVYEMLTGHLPYGDLADRKLNRDNLSKLTYISSLNHNPMIPLWIDGALQKATHYDKTQRYQDLSEFIYDLEHPNHDFMSRTIPPLIERNPVAFWRTLAILLFLANIVLIYNLIQ